MRIGSSVLPGTGVPSAGPLPICCRVSEGAWEADGLRYRNLEYERDREAGRDFREDLLSPGRLRCPLRPGRPLAVRVGAWLGALAVAGWIVSVALTKSPLGALRILAS